jgi:hypothetical protein
MNRRTRARLGWAHLARAVADYLDTIDPMGVILFTLGWAIAGSLAALVALTLGAL